MYRIFTNVVVELCCNCYHMSNKSALSCLINGTIVRTHAHAMWYRHIGMAVLQWQFASSLVQNKICWVLISSCGWNLTSVMWHTSDCILTDHSHCGKYDLALIPLMVLSSSSTLKVGWITCHRQMRKNRNSQSCIWQALEVALEISLPHLFRKTGLSTEQRMTSAIKRKKNKPESTKMVSKPSCLLQRDQSIIIGIVK